MKLTGIAFSYGKPRQNSNSTQQQPPGIMVPFDIYHPTTTAEFIIAGNIIEGGDTTDTTPAIDPIDILSRGIAGLTRSVFRGAARGCRQRRAVFLRYKRDMRLKWRIHQWKREWRSCCSDGALLIAGASGAINAVESQYWSLRNPLSKLPQ